MSNQRETVTVITSLRYNDHAELVAKARRHGLTRDTVYRHALLYAMTSGDFERRLARVARQLHKIRGA